MFIFLLLNNAFMFKIYLFIIAIRALDRDKARMHLARCEEYAKASGTKLKSKLKKQNKYILMKSTVLCDLSDEEANMMIHIILMLLHF